MGLKNKILLIVILFVLTGCYSQAYFEEAEAKNKQHTEKITIIYAIGFILQILR